MKKSIAIVLVVAIALMLVACGGGGSALLGKWQDETGMATLELRNDGKVIINEPFGEEYTFNYKVEGNKITVEYMGKEATSTYKIEGNVLTITDESGTVSTYNRK